MEKVFGRIINHLPSTKSMEAALAYIRSFGFVFMEPEPFFDVVRQDSIKERHQGWQFMIRRVKKEKYDTRLFFATKLHGNKVDRLAVYYEGNHLSTLKIEWADRADINFRKLTKHWAFPDYMTYDERRVWRAEHKRVMKNPNHKPTEYYLKCKPDIIYSATPL